MPQSYDAMNMTSHAESRLHLVGNPEAEIAALIEAARPFGITYEQSEAVETEVPIELICREDVPVDQDHVDELKAAIEDESRKSGSTGQLSRVLLAQVPGRDKLYIIDGFHRDAALSQLGRTSELVTIRPSTSEEELLDLRLLTANTHKSVAFARITDWIGDAWSKTVWAEKITASQAFGLNVAAATGKGLGLAPDETQAIKAWVQDKADRWHMSTSSIRLNLLTADTADPELAKAARRRPSGRSLDALTPNHLRVIAEALPHRYELQRLVDKIVREHALSAPRARAVALEIAKAEDVEAALEIDRQMDWSKIQAAYGKTRTKELKRNTSEQSEEPTSKVSDDGELSMHARRGYVLTQLELGVTSIQNLVYAGGYSVPDELERQAWQPVIVHYADNADAMRILTPIGSERLSQDFDARMQTIQAQLVDKVRRDVGWTPGEAKTLTYHVADRISADIEAGALRFMGSVHASVLDKLAINAIASELRKKRDIYSLSEVKRGRHAASPVEIAIDDVAEKIGGLKELERKQLVLGGFMQLCHHTVMQVLHVDGTIESNLAQAHKRRFASGQ